MGPEEGCLTHVCSARHILVFSFLSLCCFIPELSLESKMREIHRLPEPQGSVKRDWELSSCCWLKDFLSRHSVLKRLCSDPSVLDPAERFTEHKRTRSAHFFSLHWAASILPAARLWRPRVEVDPDSTCVFGHRDTASSVKGIVSEAAIVSRAWPNRWNLKTMQAS